MESHIAPAYSLILSLVVFTQSIWGKAHTLYVVYVFACTLATMIWGELFVYDSLFAINNRVVPSLSLFFFLFFFYIACHCTPYWNTALLHSDLERWCDIKCSFIHSQATCCLCLVFHDILCFFLPQPLLSCSGMCLSPMLGTADSSNSMQVEKKIMTITQQRQLNVAPSDGFVCIFSSMVVTRTNSKIQPSLFIVTIHAALCIVLTTN